MIKFDCYYEIKRFAYIRKYLNPNIFVRKGEVLRSMRKTAVFVNDRL